MNIPNVDNSKVIGSQPNMVKENSSKSSYKDIDLEKFKEQLTKIWEEASKQAGLTLPQGRIGDTDMYRISDNLVTGIGGWRLYLKALDEEMKKRGYGNRV